MPSAGATTTGVGTGALGTGAGTGRATGAATTGRNPRSTAGNPFTWP